MSYEESDDSTKDNLLMPDFGKVLLEEHHALREWLEGTLGEHRRLLQDHTQSLKMLLELSAPQSPLTPLTPRHQQQRRSQQGRLVDHKYTTGSVVLDMRRSTKGSAPTKVADSLPEETSTFADVVDRSGSQTPKGSSDGKAGDCQNEWQPNAGSGCGWHAITPTTAAPGMPSGLTIAAPATEPFVLVDADAGDTQEELPHPLGVIHHPTSASLARSWTSVESLVTDNEEADQDRAEWTKHLQRRVTEQLGGKHSKKLKRASSIKITPPRRVENVRMKLRGILEGTLTQWVCAGVIVLNVAFIGYATDKGMKNMLAVPPQPDPDWFKSAETVFTVWYCVELFVRVFAFGFDFLAGPEKKWNAFDTVLVFLSLVEAVVQDIGVGFGALRVLRGLRMFRVLRIIRVMRFFRDLRLMVCSILQSLGSLSWSLLLLGTIMYLFSVVLMQGATLGLLNDAEEGRVANGVLVDGVKMWYSSVLGTMYTLLASIVNGVDWVAVVRPLEEISLVYRWIFAFYMVFVVIGVLNVLTGIFVERACELSGLDKDLVIQGQMKRNDAFLIEMRRIFEEADEDNSGAITWQEFKEYLEDDRVKAYLSTQQLDAYDARTLFDILTEGGTELTIEAFIVGCQRLKGLARSVDLVAVLEESRAANKKLKAIMRQMEGTGTGTVNSLTSYSRRPSNAMWSPRTDDSP